MEEKMNEDISIFRNFLDKDYSTKCFAYLLKEIKWHEELISTIDESKVKINRKMAYVAEKIGDYTYANLKFKGEGWNECLLGINARLNETYNFKFNSVLLNLYKDGKDEIKWHSDKEEIIGPNPIIACVNLGATRKFWFRKKKVIGDEKYIDEGKFFYEVHDGDLLIMGENCQKNYLHAILKESDIKEPRISLTFRKVIYGNS